MTIAGVEPVGYTEAQVREILIKFCKEYEIDGRAYEMGVTIEDFVDEFMNSGDQKNELFKVARNRIKEY